MAAPRGMDGAGDNPSAFDTIFVLTAPRTRAAFVCSLVRTTLGHHTRRHADALPRTKQSIAPPGLAFLTTHTLNAQPQAHRASTTLPGGIAYPIREDIALTTTADAKPSKQRAIHIPRKHFSCLTTRRASPEDASAG